MFERSRLVSWIDEPDYKFDSMRCRGIGEIGNTGVTAAVANAVYHVTGKRVRNLPIAPDKPTAVYIAG